MQTITTVSLLINWHEQTLMSKEDCLPLIKELDFLDNVYLLDRKEDENEKEEILKIVTDLIENKWDEEIRVILDDSAHDTEIEIEHDGRKIRIDCTDFSDFPHRTEAAKKEIEGKEIVEKVCKLLEDLFEKDEEALTKNTEVVKYLVDNGFNAVHIKQKEELNFWPIVILSNESTATYHQTVIVDEDGLNEVLDDYEYYELGDGLVVIKF